jgi:hypothetical protein
MLEVVDSSFEEVSQVGSHLLWVTQSLIDERSGLCIKLVSDTKALVWLSQRRRSLREALPILPLLLWIFEVDTVGLEVEHSAISLGDLLHINHAPRAQILQLHIALSQLICQNLSGFRIHLRQMVTQRILILRSEVSLLE